METEEEKLDNHLSIECAHGTLVDVFGIGLLIQGESSIGKSEAALGLIKMGHSLIADDLVRLKRKEGEIEGFSSPLTRHYMEVRGIGLINVALLFGAFSVKEKKSLDIVVKLEVWDDRKAYDRLGLEESKQLLLGIEIPYYTLPIKPGRDVALLLETLALNHRLKKMGCDAAKDFDAKLFQELATREKESTCHAALSAN